MPSAATYRRIVRSERAQFTALRDRIRRMRDRAKRELDSLLDMKERKDLTANWGECSLIHAKRYHAELEFALEGME